MEPTETFTRIISRSEIESNHKKIELSFSITSCFSPSPTLLLSSSSSFLPFFLAGLPSCLVLLREPEEELEELPCLDVEGSCSSSEGARLLLCLEESLVSGERRRPLPPEASVFPWMN